MLGCSISNRRIIGPYFFFETAVPGEKYRNMLSTYAIPRIRALQRRPIFMHNCALSGIYGPLKEILDQNFRNDWIERAGPLAWSRYPPDLNPCDLHLRGHTESHVYQLTIT